MSLSGTQSTGKHKLMQTSLQVYFTLHSHLEMYYQVTMYHAFDEFLFIWFAYWSIMKFIMGQLHFLWNFNEAENSICHGQGISHNITAVSVNIPWHFQPQRKIFATFTSISWHNSKYTVRYLICAKKIQHVGIHVIYEGKSL